MTVSPHPAASGGASFFTVALAQAGSSLLVDEVALLRDVVAAVRAEHPMEIDAMVILPDHLHAVWTLPPGDTGAAIRWRKIKASFARHCRAADDAARAGLWRPGLLEHHIADRAEHRRRLVRCWHDPVRHGLVSRAADWPWSSLHREIRAGRVAPHWTARTATRAKTRGAPDHMPGSTGSSTGAPASFQSLNPPRLKTR